MSIKNACRFSVTVGNSSMNLLCNNQKVKDVRNMLIASGVLRGDEGVTVNNCIVSENSKVNAKDSIVFQQVVIKTGNKIKGNTDTMSKIKSITTEQLEKNKVAAKAAAELELGRIVLGKLQLVVEKKAPMMVGALAKANPEVSKLIIANIGSIAVGQYCPNNKKAQVAANAALNAAMLETVQAFDVQGMVDNLLEEIPGGLFDSIVEDK